jgi:hypothetical protein
MEIKHSPSVGYDVLTAVIMNVAILGYSSAQSFGGMYHLHLQDRKSAEQGISVHHLYTQ